MNKEKFRQIRNLLDKRAHYPMRVAAKDTGKSMWKVSVDEMHNAMQARSGVKGKGNFVVKVDGLKKGLISTGCFVEDIGLSLSPLVYFTHLDLNGDAVAMVTASHNENGCTGV